MRRDLNLLTSPLFLAGLALLLANDLLLKSLFHNALTGKLSDFAGLFVFPFFWAALAPRRRRAVYAVTALGFVFWKSPLSQPLIDAWNALGLMRIERAADATDLLALSVLPLSEAYLLRRRRAADGRTPPTLAWRRYANAAVLLLSVFAFTATQRVGDHMVTSDREYEFGVAREELLHRLENGIGLAYVSHHRYGDDVIKRTERVTNRPVGEEDRNAYGFTTRTKVCGETVYASVTLHQKAGASVLKVEYLIYNCEEATKERLPALEREAVAAFERDVIEPLRSLEAGGP